MKSADSEAVLQDVRRPGEPGDSELMRMTVTENPDTNNVTSAKHGFAVQIFSLASVAPRETTSMQLAAKDVTTAYRTIVEALNKEPIQARVLASSLSEQDKQKRVGHAGFRGAAS